MNFQICAKCKLSLPAYLTIPIIVIINGQKTKVRVCERCLKAIKENNATNKNS